MKQKFAHTAMLFLLPLNTVLLSGQPAYTSNQSYNTQLYSSELLCRETSVTTDPIEYKPEKNAVIKNTQTAPNQAVAPVVHRVTNTPDELEQFFEQYASEYGISSETLKIIAKCESNFNAQIVSKNGLYAGLYQYSAATWKSTRKQMGLEENPDLRFDAQEAIRTSAFKISRGGISAWPTCGKKAQALDI